MKTDKCKCGANQPKSCPNCSMVKVWGYVNGERKCYYSAFSTEVTYKHPRRIADKVLVRMRKKFGHNAVFYAEMNSSDKNTTPFHTYRI